MLHSGWLAYCKTCREIVEDGSQRTYCAKGHKLDNLLNCLGWDAYGWYEYRKKAGKWKLTKIDRQELIVRIQNRWRPRRLAS